MPRSLAKISITAVPFITVPASSMAAKTLGGVSTLVGSITGSPIGHGHCLHVCNLQPKSRGAVTLKTANPADPPAIQFNYCKHPDDLDKMVKAVKIGRKVVDSPSLKRHTTREHTPGDDVQTDDEIRSFIREKAQTIYHPVGTCKMGTDELSVVDENLRVYGTTNLRVVDASVMPKINSGNTHATVIAIADKASELISSACHSKRPQ